MKIQEKLEFFSQIVLKEVDEKRIKLKDELDHMLKTANEKTKNEAEKEMRTILAAEEYHAVQLKNNSVSDAKLRAKSDLYKTRQKMTDMLFDNIKSQLLSFAASSAYKDYLIGQVSKVSKNRGDVLILLNENDMKFADEILESNPNIKIKALDTENDIPGGFVMQYEGKKTMIDCLFQTKFNEQKAEFIWKQA